MGAQETFDKAVDAYCELQSVIEELSDEVKKTSPKFSTEVAKNQFDLILQSMLLKLALSSGEICDIERQFISKIVLNEDVTELFKDGKGNQLTWDTIGEFSYDTIVEFINSIDEYMADRTNEFIGYFAKIDAVSEKDYCEIFRKKLIVICVSLQNIDGESLDKETETGVAVIKDFCNRWQAALNKVESKSGNSLKSDLLGQFDDGLAGVEAACSKRMTISKTLLNKEGSHLLNYADEDGYLNAVVYIETDSGSGTGFIVTADGYAVTCAHVVDGAKEISAKINIDGKPVFKKAKIIAASQKQDIALIKIEDGDYPYVEVSIERNPAKLGKEVVILGYPLGKMIADDVMNLEISLCKGYVSSHQIVKGVELTMLDVDVKPGYSGSPVIQVDTGRVIGILAGSLMNRENNYGVDYMMPLWYLNNLLDD